MNKEGVKISKCFAAINLTGIIFGVGQLYWISRPLAKSERDELVGSFRQSHLKLYFYGILLKQKTSYKTINQYENHVFGNYAKPGYYL